MNAIYNIRHKGKIALLLLALIFLELFNSNLHDDNLSKIGESFSEVYADRLLVQDYIFKLTNEIYQRKLLLAQHKNNTRLNEVKDIFNNHSLGILSLIASYEKTKLTPAEQTLFSDFKTRLLAMIVLEKKYLQSKDEARKQQLLWAHNQSTNLLLAQLQKLSAIQITEGRQLNDNSQKIVAGSEAFMQFDWALIILIGLAIQAFVFASKSVIPKQTQHHSLN